DRGRLRRIAGRVLDDEHVARAGVDLELLQQGRAQPVLDRADAAGVALELLAHARLLGELEIAYHAVGDLAALDQVDLGVDPAGALARRDAAGAGAALLIAGVE